MRFEVEISDAEFAQAIQRGGSAALNSPKMRAIILAAQEEKIAEIIHKSDVSALVRMEIDATMKHVIEDGVRGRIRAIVRPIIEQEVAKLRGNVQLETATGADQS